MFTFWMMNQRGLRVYSQNLRAWGRDEEEYLLLHLDAAIAAIRRGQKYLVRVPVHVPAGYLERTSHQLSRARVAFRAESTVLDESTRDQIQAILVIAAEKVARGVEDWDGRLLAEIEDALMAIRQHCEGLQARSGKPASARAASARVVRMVGADPLTTSS